MDPSSTYKERLKNLIDVLDSQRMKTEKTDAIFSEEAITKLKEYSKDFKMNLYVSKGKTCISLLDAMITLESVKCKENITLVIEGVGKWAERRFETGADNGFYAGLPLKDITALRGGSSGTVSVTGNSNLSINKAIMKKLTELSTKTVPVKKPSKPPYPGSGHYQSKKRKQNGY